MTLSMINSYDSVSFATFANCVAVMPEIYTKGCMEKLDKIAEMCVWGLLNMLQQNYIFDKFVCIICNL